MLAVYSIRSELLAIQMRECQDLGTDGLNGQHRYDPAHRRAYTLAEARRLVADAGLTIAHQAGFRIDRLWRGWMVTGQRPPAPRGTPETPFARLPPGATHPPG